MSGPVGQDGWDGILNPSERILWQGQPGASVDLSGLSLRRIIPAVAIAGFTIFWSKTAIDGALQDGPIGLVFPLFGLFFLTLTLHSAGGHVLVSAWRRRNTWYTLTSQRAFIATSFLGRKSLDAYPITAMTVLEHDGQTPGNIWFATDFKKTKQGSKRIQIGFERLDDSSRVHDLMRLVQQEQA